MNIIFIEKAKLEFEDHVLYYELENSELGDLLKNEIKRILNILIKYPKIGSNEKYGLKSLLLHKFPLKLIYSIENANILILAIAHQQRDPEYWTNRL